MADTPAGTEESFASIEDAMGSLKEPDEENRETGTLEESDDEGLDAPAGLAGDGEEFADDGDDDEDPDGSGETPGGSLATDDARVQLQDGSWTTVGELRRGSLRQADYTHKAMALAEDRRALQEAAGHVQSFDAELQQQRETVAFFLQAMMPQEPDPSLMESDFMGYQMQKAHYDQAMQQLARLDADHRQHAERRYAEMHQAEQMSRAEQWEMLVERAPELGKRDNYARFWDSALKAGEFYGYTPQELDEGLTDHRQYLVLRDALAYRRIKARNAEQRPKPERRPVITGGRSNGGQPTPSANAKARFTRNPTLRNALDMEF